MLSKLTKIKILLIFVLLIGFLIKKDSLREYLVNNDIASFLTSNDKQVVSIDDKIEHSEDVIIPKIAILVIDLGLQNKTLQQSFNTNPKIGLGFSVYSDKLTTITQTSIEKGHDTMLLLPTQPLNYLKNDPGPHALLMDTAVSENARKFSQITEKLIMVVF